MESCNTESSLDLPLESLSLQSFLQSLHKEQWQEVRLGDITSIIGDGLHGTPNFDVNGECFFINGNNLNDGQIIIKKDTKKVSSIEYAKYKKDINEKTILISINGTLGNMALYRGENIMLGKSACYLNFKDNVSRNFMRYVIINNDFQRYLNISATGTTILNVSLKAIRDFTFLLPPLTIQQKIAEILSSFDDKIDLLHRQNKTLESLALTLFRHYFIDNPKRDEWEEKPLSEVAYFLNGLACQKLPPRNDKDRLPVLKIKELKEGISQASDWATSEIDSQYIVENGDVIFAWSASLMVKMWNGSRCVLNQHLFKVTSQVYPKWFYYFWCKYHLQDFIAIANAHATTMGHIKRQDLDLAMCVIPDTQSLQTIDKEIAPLLQKININSKQIQNLQAMRDMLLKAIFA